MSGTPIASRPRIMLNDPTATANPVLLAASIALGLVLGFVVIALTTDVGWSVFDTAWTATLGSPIGITEVIRNATPLLLAGTAVAVGRVAGLWNIGVEGQLFIGAWATTGVSYLLDGLPGPLLVLALLSAAFVAGAVYILLPALARAYLGVNEIITTLMLNFVAVLWVTYWVLGPWQAESQGSGNLSARPLPEEAAFGKFTFGEIVIGGGTVFAVVGVLCVAAALRYTRFGYRSRLLGADTALAEYAGVAVRRTQLKVMLLSGGIGGLSGGVLMLDQGVQLSPTMSANTGYLGIVVAALAGVSIAACIPMSVVLGGLVAIGLSLQIAGVPATTVQFLTGLLILVAAAADVVARYRFRLGTASGPSEAPPDNPDDGNPQPTADVKPNEVRA